jgi:hypothetical protein
MGSPAFSDDRQQDVAAVRLALDRVAPFGGSIRLPLMTAAELCALGALGHPLVDARTLAWWNAQPDHEALSRLAYGSLAKRKLLDTETGRVSPPLGLILAGRSRPSFILITRDKPAAEPNPLRLYGIADESGVRAVLAEGAQSRSLAWAGPGYGYMLTGVATQSRALAEAAAERRQLVFDVFRPPARSPDLPAERTVVTRVHHRLRVERQVPGATVPVAIDCDLDALADLLAGMMTGAR